MSTLSNNDIQFIENYLEHSDVFYADIRMEMTDHVASSIEKQIASGDDREFYDIFKDYMLDNKANLLKSNKQFLRHSEKAIFKTLINRIASLPTFVIFILSFFLIYLSVAYIDLEVIKSKIQLIPIVSIVPFCIIYLVALNRFKLSRFSGIERLAFVYMLIFQVFNLLTILVNKHLNDLTVVLLISTMITIGIVVIQITMSTIKRYRNNYQFLN